MSLLAVSDVRALPPSESPQPDSLAANRLARGSSQHNIATSRAKDASRGSGISLRNGKYEHFAHLIAKGESPAKAYVLCGYSSNGALQSGNRLLRNPDVSARVEELKTAVSERQVEKIAVDRAWVILMLTENVLRAMQVEPVRDRDGNTDLGARMKPARFPCEPQTKVSERPVRQESVPPSISNGNLDVVQSHN
jgi:hypothetical protein